MQQKGFTCTVSFKNDLHVQYHSFNLAPAGLDRNILDCRTVPILS